MTTVLPETVWATDPRLYPRYDVRGLFKGQRFGIGQLATGATRFVGQVTAMLERTITVPGATAVATYTIWDATVDHPSSFKYLGIKVDPLDQVSKAGKAVNVTIEKDSGSVVVQFTVPTQVLFQLGGSEDDDGTVDKIIVSNRADTVSPTDDLDVKMLLVDAA